MSLNIDPDMEPHVTGPWSPNPPLLLQTWDLAVQGPPGPSLLATSGCHHWRPVQTCSLQNPLPHQYRHLVATEAHTVGKWVVRILLECFLVSTVKSIYILYGSNVPYPFHRSAT